MWMAYTGVAAGALALLALIRLSIVRVRAREAVVIERGGKLHRCLGGGWHCLWPLRDRPRSMYWRCVETGLDGKERVVDRLRWRIDLRPTHFELPELHVATEDQVPFTVKASCAVAVDKPEVAVYADAHLPRAACDAAAGCIQQEIAKLSSEALIKDVAGATAKVAAELAPKLADHGLRLGELYFVSALPADEVRAAIEKKVAAATNKEASLLEADTAAEVALQEGKTKQQLQIMEAEAKRKAIHLTADADAEAIQKIASVVQDPEVARHALAIRYLDVLRQMAEGPGARTVFIPYDAGVSAGSLDLLRQCLQSASKPDDPSG